LTAESKYERGKRDKKENPKYSAQVSFLEVNNVNSEYNRNEPIPKSTKHALNGQNRDQWKKAIDVELDNMSKNQVWEVVDKPRSCNFICSKWVFDLKKDAKES